MEYGSFAENQVRVAVLRWHQHLHSILVRQNKRLPFAEIAGSTVSVDHHKVELAVQTGYQLPGFTVTVDAPQHIPRRDGNVVLYELDIYATFQIEGFVVRFNVFASEVLEDIQLYLQHAIQISFAHFHGSTYLRELEDSVFDVVTVDETANCREELV